MNGMADSWRRVRTFWRHWRRSVDAPLAIIVLGFVLVLALASETFGAVRWLSRVFGTDPDAAYEAALAAAAVKRPSYRKELATVDPNAEAVEVVTFRSTEFPLDKRTSYLWSGLRDEVRKACAGAADPARRLQQVLGLPPIRADNYVVVEFTVAGADLIRPCFGKGSLQGATCAFELPDPPADGASADVLKAEYNKLRFMADHMWNSYRAGFTVAGASRPGYPFTGMGWSFDWGDHSKGNFGVSEFMISKDAAIKIRKQSSPVEFCGK
jgi:hypothetical protein